MKKSIVFFIGVVFVLTACHKNSVPTITTRKKDPPPPISATLPVKPDMDAGKTIFIVHCGRCHDLPDPFKYTAPRWESILKTMIPRAKLNREEAVHIRAYINANAGH